MYWGLKKIKDSWGASESLGGGGLGSAPEGP